MFRNWINKWFGPANNAKRHARPRTTRLGIENLEGRDLMAASLNVAPVLPLIANQEMSHTQDTMTIALLATDANRNPLTFAVGAPGSAAYALDQSLGLSQMVAAPKAARAMNAVWMKGRSGTYGILPNGEVRQWKNSVANTMRSDAVVAVFDAGYYADPSRLWNAVKPAALPVAASIKNGVLTLDPVASYVGTLQMEVAVRDGKATVVRSFNVAVTNSAPVLATIPDQSMHVGETIVLDLTALDKDGDQVQLTVRDLSVPNGIVPPAGSVWQEGNRLFIKSTGEPGSFTIEVTASDAREISVDAFTVTVTNTGPVLEPIPDQQLDRRTALTIPLQARDADGDAITCSARIVDSGEIRPAVVFLDMSVRADQLTIQPMGLPGTFTIEVTASDGGAVAVQTFTLSIVNAAPVVEGIPDQSGPHATTILIPLAATDGDNDMVSYSALSVAGGPGLSEIELIVDGVQLAIHPHAYSGTFTVEVAASDGMATTTRTFQVTVEPPVIVNPNVHISPIDGSTWELQDGVLYCNGEIVQVNVGKFVMLPNGDRLMVYHQTAFSRWGWVVGGHSMFERFHGGVTSSYQDFNDFVVRSDNTILAWGVTLDRWNGDDHETLTANVVKASAQGDAVLVQDREGVLKRYSAGDPVPFAEGVADFDFGSGVLTVAKTDGTRESTLIDGDFAAYMAQAQSEDAQQSPADNSQVPLSGVYGVVGATKQSWLSKRTARRPSAAQPALGCRSCHDLVQRAGLLRTQRHRHRVGLGRKLIRVDGRSRDRAGTNQPFDRSLIRFLTGGSAITTTTGGVTVVQVWGRSYFGGRDLAILKLETAMTDVVGAQLPAGTPQAGDRILVVGYGRNNESAIGGVQTFGYATLDGVGQDYPGVTGPFLVNTFRSGEAAFDHGDSGGPDLMAQRTYDDNGRAYWTPILVGVHHGFADKVPPGQKRGNNRTDIGEDTYSVQMSAEVVQSIKSIIPPPVKVADLWIKVTDDGDPYIPIFNETGEWQMDLNINGVNRPIRRDYRDGNVNRLVRVAVENVSQLQISFGGWELDSPGFPFFDPHDLISTLTADVNVPRILMSPISLPLGSRGGETAYEMWINFGFTWE